MAFKLTISDQIQFPVQLEVNDQGTKRLFSFDLVARRLSQQEMADLVQDQEQMIRDFLVGNVTGWKRQQLVLDENDKPAEFSAEAFEVLLSLQGAGLTILGKYIEANSARAKEKN